MESCGSEEERGCTTPLLDDIDVSSSRKRGSAASAQTLGNILVSLLGTGALGLPYAFRVAGWLAASLALVVAAVSTCYCMLLLVSLPTSLSRSLSSPLDLLLMKVMFGEKVRQNFTTSC